MSRPSPTALTGHTDGRTPIWGSRRLGVPGSEALSQVPHLRGVNEVVREAAWGWGPPGLWALPESPVGGRAGGLLAAVPSVDTRGQQVPSFGSRGQGPGGCGSLPSWWPARLPLPPRGPHLLSPSQCRLRGIREDRPGLAALAGLPSDRLPLTSEAQLGRWQDANEGLNEAAEAPPFPSCGPAAGAGAGVSQDQGAPTPRPPREAPGSRSSRAAAPGRSAAEGWGSDGDPLIAWLPGFSEHVWVFGSRAGVSRSC